MNLLDPLGLPSGEARVDVDGISTPLSIAWSLIRAGAVSRISVTGNGITTSVDASSYTYYTTDKVHDYTEPITGEQIHSVGTANIEITFRQSEFEWAVTSLLMDSFRAAYPKVY